MTEQQVKILDFYKSSIKSQICQYLDFLTETGAQEIATALYNHAALIADPNVTDDRFVTVSDQIWETVYEAAHRVGTLPARTRILLDQIRTIDQVACIATDQYCANHGWELYFNAKELMAQEGANSTLLSRLASDIVTH